MREKIKSVTVRVPRTDWMGYDYVRVKLKNERTKKKNKN